MHAIRLNTSMMVVVRILLDELSSEKHPLSLLLHISVAAQLRVTCTPKAEPISVHEQLQGMFKLVV